MNCDLNDAFIYFACTNVNRLYISMLYIVTKSNLETIFFLIFFFHQVKQKSSELIQFMLLLHVSEKLKHSNNLLSLLLLSREKTLGE